MSERGARPVEWPTLGLLVLCYSGWILATTWLAEVALAPAIALLAVTAGLHASLSHEVIHGHPFRNRLLNAALVFPALSITVPYLRFAATHLAHHHDEILTDPYDDPETNFLDPAVWERLPSWRKVLLRLNNTLLGRILLGPLIGNAGFIALEAQLALRDPAVLRGWLWHVPALALVIWWLSAVATMPLWAFVLGTYLSHSLLKIRTFLEHQAHEKARARTVIIEDRGPLALLFLNNNFHVVHHMHPNRPWYDLPALYAKRKEHYLRRNEGYRYASYGEVFRRYLGRAKDPVPHPLWQPPGE
ncbi:MAG: fatty acid desaturase [Rhodobacteraceae bacterium]|nr:fatty acid desaturase [Paracoccaceae bacterium]MBR9822343.1 fatty acid desaturase [Paracoccaceae bacterium]